MCRSTLIYSPPTSADWFSGRGWCFLLMAEPVWTRVSPGRGGEVFPVRLSPVPGSTMPRKGPACWLEEASRRLAQFKRVYLPLLNAEKSGRRGGTLCPALCLSDRVTPHRSSTSSKRDTHSSCNFSPLLSETSRNLEFPTTTQTPRALPPFPPPRWFSRWAANSWPH